MLPAALPCARQRCSQAPATAGRHAGVFPNKETGYLAAYLPAEYLDDKLFVISLLPPKSPKGDQPVVWPDSAYQAR